MYNRRRCPSTAGACPGLVRAFFGRRLDASSGEAAAARRHRFAAKTRGVDQFASNTSRRQEEADKSVAPNQLS
jgi:hypothetical protein